MKRELSDCAQRRAVREVRRGVCVHQIAFEVDRAGRRPLRKKF
jgi:hypothetical protein